MIRSQAHDRFGPLPSDIPRHFLFAAKPEVINRRWLSLKDLLPETRLQSSMRLPPTSFLLPRPLHQLLLFLTKVPAAQSQGKEVGILEVVGDLVPHLQRELVQAPGILGLSRLASFLGRFAPGPGAGGRGSLSLRHLPSPRRVSTERPAGASSIARSIASMLLVSRPRSPFLPPTRRSPRSPLPRHLTSLPGWNTCGR